jgi:hypothetical protein
MCPALRFLTQLRITSRQIVLPNLHKLTRTKLTYLSYQNWQKWQIWWNVFKFKERLSKKHNFCVCKSVKQIMYLYGGIFRCRLNFYTFFTVQNNCQYRVSRVSRVVLDFEPTIFVLTGGLDDHFTTCALKLRKNN